MSRKAVRVRSSALPKRLKEAENSRQGTALAPMLLEPTIPASMVLLLSGSLQHRHLFLSELQRGCSYVLLKVRNRGGTWDGQHHGRVPKQPGERHLRWGGLVAPGDLVEGTAGPRQPSRSEWVPGYESYPL